MRAGRYTQQLREREIKEQRHNRGGSVGLLGNNAFPRALGQLATRSRINTNVIANANPWMCRTSCQSSEDITSLQMGFCNWYANIAGEHGTANTIGITASIEYPAGTFTQMTYGGNPQGTAVDNTTLMSDEKIINIPKFTQFWRRYFLTPISNIAFQNGASQGITPWFAGGDAWHTPGTDQTLSGTVADSGTGSSIWGTFIVGQTSQRNAVYFGDSRAVGVFDATMSAPGYSGSLERPLGAQAAFFNMATPGDRADTFLSSHTQRLAIALAYSNTVVIGWGINEARAGVPVLTQVGSYNAVATLLPGKQLYIGTIDTNTNGAWTLANGSDQTVIASVATARPAYNTAIRSVPAGPLIGYRKFLELANTSSLGGTDIGANDLCNANGGTNTFFADGLHQKTAQNILYSFSY